MAPRSRLAALAAILVLAGLLRYTGLGAGLRHTPFIDEQFFVVNVEGMLDRGDLDHRFHMYPGFFFYLLMPVLALVQRPFDASAYLAARYVVATFGVLTVALVYLLGARVWNARAGLLGALIIAVSPVAVSVAHEVRPDVPLSFFAVLGLLIIARLDGSWRRDALGGIGIGMATAIKFTGVAMAVPFILRRLAIGPKAVRGLVLAGLVSVLTYAVLSPYSFLHFDDFLEGVAAQESYHNQLGPDDSHGYFTMVRVYLFDVLRIGLGAPALVAALAGLWVARRDWRSMLPLVALPLTMIAILSTADLHRNRYVLAGLGGLAVLAGVSLDAIWMRSRALGMMTALIVAGNPLADSARAVASYRRPGTMDRVLDWMPEHVPSGARIATTHPRIGFGVGRYEVVPVADWDASGLRAAAQADVVITTVADGRSPMPGFVQRYVALPEYPLEGPPLVVLTREGKEGIAEPLDLRQAILAASENPEGLRSAVDGSLETRWQTKDTQRPGMWIEVALPVRRVIDRVELWLGGRPNQWGRHLEIATSEDGLVWTDVKTTAGRGAVAEQVAGEKGHSQVFLFVSPSAASKLRIRIVDPAPYRWGVAELSVWVEARRP